MLLVVVNISCVINHHYFYSYCKLKIIDKKIREELLRFINKFFYTSLHFFEEIYEQKENKIQKTKKLHFLIHLIDHDSISSPPK